MAGKEDAFLMRNEAKAHGSDINDAVFVNNSDLVTCSSDKTAKLWTCVHEDTKDEPNRVLDERQYAIYSMDFSVEKNLLLIASMDGVAKIWSTQNWSLMAEINPPEGAAIRTCRFSANAHLAVLAGDDDAAHLYNFCHDDFRLLKSFKSHEATIFFATFSHESSHLITGDNDGVLLSWKIKGEQSKPSFRVDDAHDLGVTSGACSTSQEMPYSIIVTGGNDCLLKVWKLHIKGQNTGHLDNIKILSGHGGIIMSVKFSNDGKVFASTSGDKTCRLWHGANFLCLRVLEGHDRYVNCVAFSPLGDFVVTGSNDRSFNVWKLSGPLCNSNLRPTSGAVSTIHFLKTKV